MLITLGGSATQSPAKTGAGRERQTKKQGYKSQALAA